MRGGRIQLNDQVPWPALGGRARIVRKEGNEAAAGKKDGDPSKNTEERERSEQSWYLLGKGKGICLRPRRKGEENAGHTAVGSSGYNIEGGEKDWAALRGDGKLRKKGTHPVRGKKKSRRNPNEKRKRGFEHA